MRIARRADHRRMAWKNGKGLTEEVAAFPQGSDVDSFDWRLSIAHVGADGPFSRFEGIDRTIALLDGDGIELNLPDGSVAALLPGGEPFAFPGEWDISSRNVGGATIDLNIMTRRGRCSHRMERMMLAATQKLTFEGEGWLVFNGPAEIASGDEVISLERFDAVSLETGEVVTNHGTNAAEVLLIRLGADVPLS